MSADIVVEVGSPQLVLSVTGESVTVAGGGGTGVPGPPGPQGPQGPQGPAGAAATVAVGTTTTGAAGSSALVTNSGSSSAAVFNFTIPQGIQGVTGSQGPQGSQGPTGPAGPSAVSANANNKATLGSDSLILVQGTVAGASATTHSQVVSGDDPQLTNARTPTAHGANHLTTDAIPDVTLSTHGLCVPPDGTTIQITGGKLVATGGGGGSGTKTIATCQVSEAMPPLNNYATLGESANNRSLLVFDQTTSQTSVWLKVCPQGATLTSGLVIDIFWFVSVTSGSVKWNVQIDHLSGTDFTTDTYDTLATGTGTANATANLPVVTSIPITTIDGLVAQDGYALKLSRDTSVGGNAAAAANVFLVAVRTP